jgi:ABC-type dipeptide/oligopeptide/nickel transport system ATPase component
MSKMNNLSDSVSIPASNSDTLLDVRQLSIWYAATKAKIHAVDHVSFTIHAGEVLGLVGESGSGKSTIAQAILGLHDAQSTSINGEIEFNGRNIFSFDEHDWESVRGRRIGMLFQSPESSFNPVATIGEQISEALRWHQKLTGPDAWQCARDALLQVGMPRHDEVMHNYAFELSGGMCQRAALALVMALQPALIIADEPTASLDVIAQAELVRWLVQIQRQRRFAMLVISHDLNLIARLANRVLIMRNGRILEQGNTSEVLTNPQHPYTRQLLTAVPRLSTNLDPVMDVPIGIGFTA